MRQKSLENSDRSQKRGKIYVQKEEKINHLNFNRGLVNILFQDLTSASLQVKDQ